MEILGNSEEENLSMCGIAGITGRFDESCLREMIKSITHRGPDYEGIYINKNVGLAHARLSIIDITTVGNQPMHDNENNLSIVFNGEIYNYQILKKELSKKYSFKSDSDTEVLIYLYKEYGKNMLNKINGMFVFAIYDFIKKELFIAKDRMGKKPLYYSELNDSFIFASELKAIIKNPAINKELNLNAISQYLTFDYVPTPNTLFKKVFKMEAGHYMIIKENRIIESNRYWNYNFNINNKISFNEAQNKLDSILNRAVKDRLMSDVPLGVFLSGGLDSSTIAYYAQKNSSKQIKTFSIGFEDKSYDESNYAQKVANHINSKHYSEILKPKDTTDLIEEIYPKVDEPLADASLIPTYYLSKITKKNVTVALGGDGSDELLGGYPTFISNKFKTPFYATRNISLPILNSIIKHLPVKDNNISLDFKINQFLRGFSSKKEHIHQLWLGSFLPKEKNNLFRKDLNLNNRDGLSLIDSVFKNCNSKKDFNQIIQFYCETYLHDDILVKVDRASMLNSLEVRAPFLDVELIEFVNSLPVKYKMKGFSGKYILKKLMENKIPNEIIYRPKKGFGIPLSKWLREDLKSMRNDLLSKKSINKIGIFDYEYIRKIINEHDNFKKNHRKLIWNLIILQLWFENYN